jgi:spore coat protein U-like protein
MSKKATIVGFLLSILSPASLFAACTVGATAMNFGTINPFSSSNTDVNGTITISCDVLSPLISYTLTLSAGGDNSYNPRHMLSGANTLNYNLFTTTARTTIWGDGTAGTSTVSALGVACVLLPCTQTVYGRVPGSQTTVHVGAYTATITATLTLN